MTEREATKILNKVYLRTDEDEIWLSYEEFDKAFKKAFEALRNQSILLDFLVSLEISNICEDDRMQEWCEEQCAYACPQKECYLKWAEFERSAEE